MVVLAFIVGAVFVSIRDSSVSLRRIISGGLTGFLIAILCFFGDRCLFRWLRHLPFSVSLTIRTTFYAATAIAVVVFSRLVVLGSTAALVMEPRHALGAILITITLSFVGNLLFMTQRMLGRQVLLNFFSGRYHKPVEEARLFMFLDVISSTSIAEQIGHVNYHVLLDRFFCDIGDPIWDAGGEIYKYVGDEVIVSWPLAKVREGSPWIECFFAIRETIAHKRQEYLGKFGLVPHFKAAIHCGMVVVGEMGDYKREIAFLGDTVNTTAKILEVCKSGNTDLLVSADVAERMNGSDSYEIRELGRTELRGKQAGVTLFSIHKRDQG